MMKTKTPSGENVPMKSKQLDMRSLEESKDNNRRTTRLDFITRLPFELVTDIMKYFEPYELIRLFQVSEEWQNSLLRSSALWSTWNINSRTFYWDYPTILKFLPRVIRHISEINLSYSTDLKYLTETLFNHICNGNLNNLESLNLYNCYISDQTIFWVPAAALLKLANTLKKLEIAYDENVAPRALAHSYNNHEEKHQATTNTDLFISVSNNSHLTFYGFQPIISILSTCHQLEYIRYVNLRYYDRSSPIPIPTTFTNNDDERLYPSLRHLEIETGSILYVDHILKRCPNLRILRLQSLGDNIESSVLDSIQHYCPYLEHLSFNYHYDLVYGKELYYYYHPKSSTRSNSNKIITPKAQSLPSSQSSSASSLKQLHIKIHDTNYAIPFLNKHADTIEGMSLSLQHNYPAVLSPVWQMNRLVSLVVSHVGYPHALAVLLPKFPFLRNLEFHKSSIMGIEVINALKRVNTLERLTIHNGTSADMIGMVDLFNAYAEASMIPTINEQGDGITDDCEHSLQQRTAPGKLKYVSLVGCNFISNGVLKALGNIKTLTTVSIGYAPEIIAIGINSFCQQLNLLPELSSISLSGLHCVNDSTLSILGSESIAITKSCDVTKFIILKSLQNVTKQALDQLSRKQDVSVISYNCAKSY